MIGRARARTAVTPALGASRQARWVRLIVALAVLQGVLRLVNDVTLDVGSWT